MKYWRCRVCDTLPWLGYLWPMFGHSIYFEDAYARCDRCPWREPLPWFFG